MVVVDLLCCPYLMSQVSQRFLENRTNRMGRQLLFANEGSWKCHYSVHLPVGLPAEIPIWICYWTWMVQDASSYGLLLLQNDGFSNRFEGAA